MKYSLIAACLIIPSVISAQTESGGNEERVRRHEISVQPLSPFSEDRTDINFNPFISTAITRKYYPMAVQYRFFINKKIALRLAYRAISHFDNNEKDIPFNGGTSEEFTRTHFLGNQFNLGGQYVFNFGKFSFYTGADALFYQEENRFMRKTTTQVEASQWNQGYYAVNTNKRFNLVHSYGVAIPLGITYNFTPSCGILLEASVDYRKGTDKNITEDYMFQKNLGTGQVTEYYQSNSDFSKPEKWNIFTPAQARVMVSYRF